MTGPELFFDGRVALHHGDCLKVLGNLAAESVDSGVVDPPYHLTSIVKRFANTSVDGEGTNERRARAGSDPQARLSRGFMGKAWDGGDVAFRVEVWIEVMRVLKPGAHLLAFGGTRTYHRLACAIEDAGFEIRDQVQWTYGSGFPKSHDVSKGLDRALGGERQVIRAEWDGWGTALKPANEPIVLARKPLVPVSCADLHALTGADYWGSERGDSSRKIIVRFERALHAGVRSWRIMLDQDSRAVLASEDAGEFEPFEVESVVANVIKYRTGALNIDGCRVAADGRPSRTVDPKETDSHVYAGRVNGGRGFKGGSRATGTTDLGRWPANIIHDGSPEVIGAFPDEAGAGGRASGPTRVGRSDSDARSHMLGTSEIAPFFNDKGSAARFFYTAKADADDRIGSKHPTVKPLDLIQYLVRLITPKGGTVLDCFAGTGTTGEAAFREGCRAILIEREAEYIDDIRRRMRLAMSGSTTRKAESLRARGKTEDPGPLFAGAAE